MLSAVFASALPIERESFTGKVVWHPDDRGLLGSISGIDVIGTPE